MNLLDIQKVISTKVVESVNGHQDDKTQWLDKTNKVTEDYINHLTATYGESWYEGFLPFELINQILLPKHTLHNSEIDDGVEIFPLDTPLPEAIMKYKDLEYQDTLCQNNVRSLKEKIMTHGFTVPIILIVINNTLKHVDGLHRLIALGLLLQEGYEYVPIPVYLCDNTYEI